MKIHWFLSFFIVLTACLSADCQTPYVDQKQRQVSEPQWDAQEIARGYAVFGCRAFPIMGRDWLPSDEQRRQPLRLALAAGETGSGVVFVRSLGRDLCVRVTPPSTLKSDNGYGVSNAYGARGITLRAVEDERVKVAADRHMVRPGYLLNRCQSVVRGKDAAQFWLTIEVPKGTPPGIYRGNVRVVLIDRDSTEPVGPQASLPVELTVRDIDLLEADIAFGTWFHTSTRNKAVDPGPAYVLPGSEEIYLADQRRHGMNTVASYAQAERKDSDGNNVVTLNEIEAMVAAVQNVGLCRSQPLLLYTWQEAGIGGGFGHFGGEENTVMAIFEHGKKHSWPELLFAVLDEPVSVGQADLVPKLMEYYTPLRKEHGVRTTVAELDPITMGEYYDVWIQGTARNNWPELHDMAAKTHSKVWMYDCAFTGVNPLYDRFFAGLWTWRTGVQGNMVWSYGWYVRINDSGMPESRIAWEARLAGVNDYRYLHTLKEALVAARSAGRSDSIEVRAAEWFLEDLRSRISLDTYKVAPKFPAMHIWDPAPGLKAEEYDGLRDQCTKHMRALLAVKPDSPE